MSPKYSSNRYTPRSIRRLKKQSSKKLIWTIILTFLVIYFLLSWGLPALVGSLAVFNKFKDAPVKNTTPATEDTAIAPPVLYIPFEATSSAKLQISGYATPDSEVEIYVDDELKDTAKTNPEGRFSTSQIELTPGTNNISGRTVLENNKKSLPSKNIKLIFSDEKPKLEVTEPGDGTNIKGGDKKVRVSGKTDPENSISVNGATVIVNGDGNFSTTADLNDGDTIILIQAVNQVGNITKIERKVNYSPS